MSVNIIQQRFASYSCKSQQEEEHAIREITQELTLQALAHAGFFKFAAFHGGTALRILYALPRFSEDLDFALHKPIPEFSFEPFVSALHREFEIYDYEVDIQDKSKISNNVKKIFFKTNSIGKIIEFHFSDLFLRGKTIRVKVEIDTNPPGGAVLENKFHNFPTTFPVVCHNKPSLFSGKLHAILCRNYLKGRDWYDFLWYIAQNIKPNFDLLKQSLMQTGPWANRKELDITPKWLTETLVEKINSINWKDAISDTERFLKPLDRRTLQFWNKELFIDAASKL